MSQCSHCAADLRLCFQTCKKAGPNAVMFQSLKMMVVVGETVRREAQQEGRAVVMVVAYVSSSFKLEVINIAKKTALN